MVLESPTIHLWTLTSGLLTSLIVTSCGKNQPDVTGPAYLYATPGSLTVVAGRETSTTVAGGKPPYGVLRHAKAPFAHDSLRANQLIVYGDNPGGTSAVIGDAASPQNTLEVPITVVANMTEIDRPVARSTSRYFTGLLQSTLAMIVIVCMVYGSGAISQQKSKKRKKVVQKPPGAISFRKDVAPVLKTYCLPCHTEDQMNPSELYLDSYENLMKGGKHGKPVIPGNPDSSLLIQKLGQKPPIGDPMPLKRKAPIPDDTLGMLKKWIGQGANND